jgi:ABC-type multidrug transport system fused ATPase/permease subunit
MQLSSSKNRWLHYLWLRSELPLIIFILINLVVSAITGFFTPRLITEFYQSIKTDEDYRYYFLLLAGLFVAEYLNRFLYQLSVHRYIQVLLTEIRRRSYDIWLKSSFGGKQRKKQEDYPLGEVLARLMNDTDAVREIVTSGSFGIFIDIIFIISCLVSFLRLNLTTGVSLFLAEVLAAFLLVKGSYVMARIFMEVRRVTGFMARVVTDLTSGLRELYFSPNERYASRRGEKIFEEFLTKQLHANVWDAGYYSAAESLYPILIAMVMIIVPYSGIVEVAILAALIDLIQRSITPIKEVASKISVIQRARTGIERIQQFNDSFGESQTQRPDFRELEAHCLRFELAEFAYDEGFGLKQVNFELKRGEVLGILGESGSGKSTLLKLLSGQFRAFDGCITLDELTVEPSSTDELSRFSSYVSLVAQDSHVFTETLEFNIGLGQQQGFAAFWEIACRSIPYLIRWGVKPQDRIDPKALSMGQKQLISGLRSLFLKKPVILMDEISSGLDSELEAALKDLIHFFHSQSMTIIVTHRLETILNSDKLILMDQGRVLASGTHAELVSDPKYQQFLAALQ